MTPSHGEITHVSDTALMVAACRALETEAPDGFVRDRFAARLAGERGMAILQKQPRPAMMQFGMGIRSRFMDELVIDTVANHNIATVVSLGCGLDTRPWRLELPPQLRWIEVDFADMLDYKETRMSSENPRCRRERLTGDLNDPAQRLAIYEAVGPEPAFMITEGLLMYLPAATVAALASEPPAHCGVAHWMSDITTSTFEKALRLDTARSLGHVQASDFLHGEQILEVVHGNGWFTAAHRSYIRDTMFARERSLRLFGNPAQSTAPPASFLADPTGIHCFARV